MKPRWHVLTVDERGGRPVYLLEHTTSAERVRIYQPDGHWRYYDAAQGDRLVDDRAMVSAVQRAIAIRRTDANAQLQLYPSSSRRILSMAAEKAAAPG